MAAAHAALHAQHVERGNALGDADDEVETGVRRLADRVGRARRRHEHHRRIGAGRGDGFAHRVEDRHAVDFGAALARRDAAHHLGVVFARKPGVEASHLADALDDELGVLVAENRHGYLPFFAV